MGNSNKYSRLLLRRSNKATLKALNPLLKEGEPMAEIDTGKLKIGDGIRRWNQLKYVGGNGGVTPAISSFTIKELTDSEGNTYDSSIIPNVVKIVSAKLNYALTSSPDTIYLFHNQTQVFKEDYPEILTRDKVINNLNITEDSSANEKKFTCKIMSDEITTNDGISSLDKSITFAPYIYWISSEKGSNDNPDNSFLSNSIDSSYFGNNKKLITNKNVTININSGDNNFIYLFLPKSIYQNITPEFYIDDSPWDGGLSPLIENNEIKTIRISEPIPYITFPSQLSYFPEYYVYISDNYGLGNTKIDIK